MSYHWQRSQPPDPLDLPGLQHQYHRFPSGACDAGLDSRALCPVFASHDISLISWLFLIPCRLRLEALSVAAGQIGLGYLGLSCSCDAEMYLLDRRRGRMTNKILGMGYLQRGPY